MALVLDGNGDITGLTTGALPSTVIGGGAVLQVVHASASGQVVVTSSTYQDTGLTATITPISSSSRILVLVNHTAVRKNNDVVARIKLLRGSGDIFTTGALMDTSSAVQYEAGFSFSVFDSPSTTSPVTYKTQGNANGSSVTYQIGTSPSTMTLLEIAG